ncbi:MAG: lysine--tRNA ligase [Patescibacteria group bacterium]|nr:lysine--tRNA ligase [Patescibacteria group bacterium]MDD5490455.1 lysine--tRNA ligase [Patescibacteria group bacterium]
MPKNSQEKDFDIIEEERDRRSRLAGVIKSGVDPYPSKVGRDFTCGKAKEDFNKLVKNKKPITVVGRLKIIRKHGGSSFGVMGDESADLQIFLRKDVLGKQYDIWNNLVDIGDFLELKGIMFATKTGEKTLEVQHLRIITKSLLPLPEKFHGLTDTEKRYRRRYLDLIANENVKNIFRLRSLIVKEIRNFFDKEGFMEVETPILQPIAGGAVARPFVTHHNALDTDLYLRIAPELYLKRLIVGGYEKIYEIARCFRNEGIDHAHNPEFTQIEFYEAYADYNDLMELTEKLFKYLIPKAVGGGMTLEFEGSKIDFTPSYPRLSFRQAVKDCAGVDIEEYPETTALAKEAKKLGAEIEQYFDRGKILDELFKTFVRPKIIQPTFITDHPVELSPLAKKIYDNPSYTERFQLLAGNVELANGYSELNDPLDQEERFKRQVEMKTAGDEEAHPFDEDFINALKHGLPPTAGFGMGIDRLTALLTDSHNLKEVILFPTLRPEKK